MQNSKTAKSNVVVSIAGAGRMGKAIAHTIQSFESLSLAAIWSREPDSFAAEIPAAVCVSTDIDLVVSKADVVVDFSLPAATNDLLAAVLRHEKALVCGVSGLSSEQMASLEKVSRQIPVVYDRNMSQGITVLDVAVAEVAAALGSRFTVEIEETHHVHKKDSPSGTALKLGESVARARGLGDSDISFKVERKGEVPGDHSVAFATPTERLVLSHSVTTRDVFAEGALRAAEWVAAQPAGLYSMHSVLFGRT